MKVKTGKLNQSVEAAFRTGVSGRDQSHKGVKETRFGRQAAVDPKHTDSRGTDTENRKDGGRGAGAHKTLLPSFILEISQMNG